MPTNRQNIRTIQEIGVAESIIAVLTGRSEIYTSLFTQSVATKKQKNDK